MSKIEALAHLVASLPDQDPLKKPLLSVIVAHHTGRLVAHCIENARRCGHGSHIVAAASYLIGLKVHSLCCGCADTVPGEAVRLGGECDRCPYVGPDCLVIIPDDR